MVFCLSHATFLIILRSYAQKPVLMDLETLVDQCIKGSKKAEAKLYHQFAPMLFGISMRYSRNRADAEDVLQEAFVRIFNNLTQYTKGKSFEGWMKRIVVNTSISYYNKGQKHAYHKDIQDDAVQVSGDSSFDNKYTKDELLQVINGLADGYRAVFNMYCIEGYKHKEIAEMLSIDENTSKSQLSRAKKMIQKKLAILDSVAINR